MKHAFKSEPPEPSSKKRKSREPMYDTKETAALFGFATAGSLHGAVQNGRFPQPDYCLNQFNNRRMYWTKSTVEAEKKRRAK